MSILPGNKQLGTDDVRHTAPCSFTATGQKVQNLCPNGVDSSIGGSGKLVSVVHKFERFVILTSETRKNLRWCGEEILRPFGPQNDKL